MHAQTTAADRTTPEDQLTRAAAIEREHARVQSPAEAAQFAARHSAATVMAPAFALPELDHNARSAAPLLPPPSTPWREAAARAVQLRGVSPAATPEQAARLGKAVAFADLCAQAKDLRELPESDQVQVLRRVKPTARPRSPKPQRPALLTALITTEAGTMHPLYRQLASHAGHHLPEQADSAWTDTVEILYDRYDHP
ncbi:hypothetical protein ABZ725_42720 [Streptomyces sp. NPDC006872]|uniref:hypothetical protein n=1 Tax=Streptomyces sp. NPDC006872 TaxID=3155720 RepID=UPI00340C4D77